MQLTFLQEDLARSLQPQKNSGPVQQLLPLASKPAAKPPAALPPAAAKSPPPTAREKSESALKTISEAAKALDVPQHVLRFWESKFPQIKPTKLRGGRRYYRPEDMAVLTRIHTLLYKEGYTIKGALKAFGKTASPQPPQSWPQKLAALPAMPTRPRSELSSRQLQQIGAIRRELLALRETLQPYVSN